VTRDPDIRRPRIGTTEQLTPERAPEPISFGTIEVIADRDTARSPLPLNLNVLDPARPLVGIAADPNPVGGTNDGYVVGRPAPGTTSHYFWPNGTEFQIVGERANDFQVRLSATLTAFVSADEVRLQPGSTVPARTLVSNVNMQTAADWIDVRFPVTRRLPFAVAQTGRSLSVTLYGATSATDWLTYGKKDPLIQHAEWEQPEDGVYRFRVDLTQPVWGYQTFWAETGNTLVLRMRRPPAIDASNPVRGLLITVDPGHGPPEGRWGPTRMTEAQANLAVALRLRDLIEAAGGRVQITRIDSSAVGLYDRPAMATRENAHLFVSIHHDAVADGVDPNRTPYTSSFFFHPHSTDFARSLQNALVDEIGLPERGYVRASLAVVRWPTWFPAVLTEAMFFIMPQQEAALRNPEMIDRLAHAHLRGIEAFLRARAAAR
jgi:N-acetylmuramoyl-L-alanine amidase